jgi:hypothetical protein
MKRPNGQTNLLEFVLFVFTASGKLVMFIQLQKKGGMAALDRE